MWCHDNDTQCQVSSVECHCHCHCHDTGQSRTYRAMRGLTFFQKPCYREIRAMRERAMRGLPVVLSEEVLLEIKVTLLYVMLASKLHYARTMSR